MQDSRRGVVVGLLVALWVAGVYAAYYAVHKPFTADSFSPIAAGFERLTRPWSMQSLADSALNLVAALWIAFVAYGAGRFLLRLASSRNRAKGATIVSPEAPTDGQAESGLGLTRLERTVLSASLGFGVIALSTFALGLAGLLYGWVFYGLFTVASALILAQRLIPWAQSRGRGDACFISKWEAFPSRASIALAIFVVVTEVLVLLEALTPPWAWDSMVYHLTGPELYLRQHQIVGGIDGMHFYFPPLVEMVFLSGMLIKGPIVANLIHWWFGLLAGGSVFCLARRLLGTEIAWLSSAILLSAPSIVILSSKPYVDMALLLYITLAFWCLLEGYRSNQRAWFLLAAAFVGFAMGVKYTSVIGVVGLGAAIVVKLKVGQNGQGKKGSVGLSFFIACCLLAATLAAPWYLKNLAFSGNPFYPFVFGGRFWDSFQAEWVARVGSGLILEPWRLLVAPLEMTVLGVEGNEGYQASIGPLFLVLLPLLALARRKSGAGSRCEGDACVAPTEIGKGDQPSGSRVIGPALAFCGTAYLLWLLGVAESTLLQQTRLLFPVFGVLSVVVAYTVFQLTPVGAFHLRRFVGAAVAIALALAFISQLTLFLAGSSLSYVVGAESREQYLTRHLGAYYDVAEIVNRGLGEDAKVYFMWEPRTYYFQRRAQPDTLLNNWRHLLFLYKDSDAVAEALRAQGYTHVLINMGGLRYFMEEPHREVDKADVDALVDFGSRYLSPILGGRLDATISQSTGGASLTSAYSLSKLD